MTKDIETIRGVLSAYASYTHVPKGFETSADLNMQQALQSIQKIIERDVIKPDNAFFACDDLHSDAYLVQPRIKASERQALTNALYGEKK